MHPLKKSQDGQYVQEMLEYSGGLWKDPDGYGGSSNAAEGFLWQRWCSVYHFHFLGTQGDGISLLPLATGICVWTFQVWLLRGEIMMPQKCIFVSLPCWSPSLHALPPRSPSSQACASGQDASQVGVCSHGSQADIAVPQSWVECSLSQTPNSCFTQGEFQGNI